MAETEATVDLPEELQGLFGDPSTEFRLIAVFKSITCIT
jgi:hypothetical protein